MIFLANSAVHLKNELTQLNVKLGKYEARYFADREFYMRLLEDVAGRNVFLIAGLQAPADNVLEALLFLDALERNGARTHLIVTHCSYARQDRVVKEGEAVSAEVIARMLSTFKLKKLHIIDIHSDRAVQIIDSHIKNVEYHFPFSIFAEKFRKMKNLAVASPDLGGVKKARMFADLLKIKELVVIEKERTETGLKVTLNSGNPKGRDILIVDDIISSGGTLIAGAKLLKEKGANDIYVVATHGEFCGDALRNLEKSVIRKIYVSNTLPQKKSEKVEVVSIADFIKEIVGE